MRQHPDSTAPQPRKRIWRFQDYFWFVLKNLVGWVLLISSIPLGMLVPGPGGIPAFLLGFGLISFPGKRRLTSRVLRGRPVRSDARGYRWIVGATAAVAPALLLSWLLNDWWPYAQRGWLVPIYLACMAGIWVFGLKGVRVINRCLQWIALARRHVRPWMRRRGIDLLPPRRRKRRRQAGLAEPDEEIIEIHERHRLRARAAWAIARPWAIRVLRFLTVGLIFWWMLRPVFREWDRVRGPILETNWWLFAGAALMFSGFLFVFRAMGWRWIMMRFGHRLSVAAATRIWSFSELARYLPGAIWQVVGRVYLTRPYGISGSVSSASQILELVVFMLANIGVALGCLGAGGIGRIPADQQHWVLIALGFVPALLILVHPKVFYGLLNTLMKQLGKPPIERALGKRQLLLLLLWNILGLLWQSMAVWMLTYGVLGLPIGRWYLLAGAYCLAWTMGFSVGFLSPGGMGVREFVFVTMLQFLLPPEWARSRFPEASMIPALAGFLGVLLRLWAICGELTMAGLAYVSDRRQAGALPLPVQPKPAQAVETQTPG